MSELKLYIKGNPVILKADSGIFLNYEANSLENLSKRSGTLSEEFEIEDCHQNRKAMGNMQLITSATEIPYELLPAHIEVKGNYFMGGSVSVSECEESYAASFSSDNADFFQKIKGKPLSDLDLSDMDHAWTPANVQAANVHDLERGYAYPLVNYGRWTSRFLDESNQHYTELFPAVYVRTLLERMASPYVLTGSLLSEDRFKRLVVAFTNEMFKYRESYRISESGTVEQNTDLVIPTTVFTGVISFNTITHNPGGNMNLAPNMQFITPYFGKYRIKVKMRVSFDFGSPSTNTNDFSLTAFTPATGVGVTLARVELEQGANQPIEWDLLSPALPAGTEFELSFLGLSSAPARVPVYILDGATFEVELFEEVMEGGAVHLDANLPDIKQDELLATVVNAFDVVIQTNDLTQTISLDLRNDMVSRPELDWTKKIDHTRKSKLLFKPSFYAQSNVFAWGENENEDAQGVALQNYMGVRMYNANAEAEKEVFVSPFTHTLNASAFRGLRILPLIPVFEQQVLSFGLYRDTVSYGNEDYVYWQGNYFLRRGPSSGEPPIISGPIEPGWAMVPEDDVFQRTDVTPRLLVMEELPEGAGIMIGENADLPTFANVTWSAKFFTDDTSLSLDFETLRAAYFGILERIIARPKFITLQMRLNSADVSLLDFMRPIAINRPELNLQGLFYLMKINQYNPAERASVAVELALIGTIPQEVTGEANREHSEEFSEEYA